MRESKPDWLLGDAPPPELSSTCIDRVGLFRATRASNSARRLVGSGATRGFAAVLRVGHQLSRASLPRRALDPSFVLQALTSTLSRRLSRGRRRRE